MCLLTLLLLFASILCWYAFSDRTLSHLSSGKGGCGNLLRHDPLFCALYSFKSHSTGKLRNTIVQRSHFLILHTLNGGHDVAIYNIHKHSSGYCEPWHAVYQCPSTQLRNSKGTYQGRVQPQPLSQGKKTV